MSTARADHIGDASRNVNRAMGVAVEGQGYSGREVADQLGLDCSTVSRLLSEEKSEGKT